MSDRQPPDLAARIAQIQAMTTAELRAEWIRLHGAPPRSGNVAWMRKRLIHRVQVAVLGDLSPEAKQRLEYLLQFAPQWIPMGRGSLANKLTAASAQPPPVDTRLKPGMTLVRPYRGKKVVVAVRENGFEHDGMVYGSLSAVAKAVTGSHMSGRAFFGLTSRGKSA